MEQINIIPDVISTADAPVGIMLTLQDLQCLKPIAPLADWFNFKSALFCYCLEDAQLRKTGLLVMQLLISTSKF